MFLPARYGILMAALLASCARAQMTEVQYLSGQGKDDPIAWQFKCDHGQNCGHWTTIGVPSNWELQGFGLYTYGRIPPPEGWPRVHGVYKRTFTTPIDWENKSVFISFEGVMTDALVTVNGQPAGPIHQGGYYAFRYNITGLLKPADQENEIQVEVADESSDPSVNNAERRGDYWNYGGIFRPVYLEAVPRTFVDHVAINASATGSLDVDVKLSDTRKSVSNSQVRASVEAQVLDKSGTPVGPLISAHDAALDGDSHLSGTLNHPLLWTAETPNLYTLEVRLKLNGVVVHVVRQRFGFRTIELRPGHGMYINGKRVFLKGLNRHSFWPDSGRTLSEQISRDDVMLIKEMNGNAVRSSHYPPDRHFLDACDELGLYVLDELSGWQAHYDTGIGKKLVREMVEHDVNHPSILFWDNGNEGGFNLDLDSEYSRYDPQRRIVLHPWAPYPAGIADTKHYPKYNVLLQRLANDPVFFPTEMLHGLYDGGAGAGLQDYWEAILESKAGAGGFVWALLDEDVKRTDKGGRLDSQGNYAPDGVVGPYREREASFYTLKQIWSPIVVTPPSRSSHSYVVTNRYAFLNADTCTYEWQSIAFSPLNGTASGSIVLASHTDHGRYLAPGESASWDGWGPNDLASDRSKSRADANRLIIRDQTGRILQTYVWPVPDFESRIALAATASSREQAIGREAGGTITAAVNGFSIQVSKGTGLLTSVSRDGHAFSFTNGPRLVAMEARLGQPQKGEVATPATAVAPDSTLRSISWKNDNNDCVINAAFNGPLLSITYRLKSNGWLSVDYAYAITGPQEYFGVGFDYPESNLKGMRFLGEGPAPVYKNRLAGGVLDVWQRRYNDTVVGDPDDLKPTEHFDYPTFKGFYAGVRWLQLDTAEGQITVVLDQPHDTPLYVQVFTPRFPPAALLGQAGAPYPHAGLSFLHGIPAIGNKFGGPQTVGPMGQPAVGKGLYHGHMSLYFGGPAS